MVLPRMRLPHAGLACQPEDFRYVAIGHRKFPATQAPRWRRAARDYGARTPCPAPSSCRSWKRLPYRDQPGRFRDRADIQQIRIVRHHGQQVRFEQQMVHDQEGDGAQVSIRIQMMLLQRQAALGDRLPHEQVARFARQAGQAGHPFIVRADDLVRLLPALRPRLPGRHHRVRPFPLQPAPFFAAGIAVPARSHSSRRVALSSPAPKSTP